MFAGHDFMILSTLMIGRKWFSQTRVLNPTLFKFASEILDNRIGFHLL